MIQIDHTGVSRDGATLKEFRATCGEPAQQLAHLGIADYDVIEVTSLNA